jgi:regulatory protein
MAKITALRENKGRHRVNVFLDGRFAFSLSAEKANRAGLRADQIVTPEQVDSLSGSDRHERCLMVATTFLGHRPRSGAELKTLLQRRGFDSTTQDSVLAGLQAQGLLDDTAFAQFWTENRESFSPRSRRLTRIELQKKGVAAEVIEQAVAAIDDEASAYRAAASHLRSVRWSDHDQFRRRLGAYLQRRGFAYGVVETVLTKLWDEVRLETNTRTDGTEIG